VGGGRCAPGPQDGDEGGSVGYGGPSGPGTGAGPLASTGFWSFCGTFLGGVPLLSP